MNKRRLLKLADLLEADARKKRGIRFNLYTIAMTDLPQKNGEPVKLNCGTQACAMGLAAISGAFQRQGLSYKIRRSGAIETTFDGRLKMYDSAAMALFDISRRQANFLFTPASYPENEMSLRGADAERYVAERIRDFVAGKVHPDTAVSP